MKNFTLKTLLTLVAALLFFSCKPNNKATAEELAREPVSKIDSIPFTMNEKFPSAQFNRIYIPVQLKDSTIYLALLDNCYTRTSFRDNLFNTVYDMSNFRAVDTLSFTASRVDFEGKVELRIGSYLLALDTIEIVNTVLFDKLFPGFDKNIIGFDLFEREIVEIDFDNHLVLIHSHLPEKTDTYLALDLHYRNQRFRYNERMPRIQLEGFVGKNQEKLTGKFLFDLGAQFTTLYPEFQAQLSSDMSQYDSLSWGYKLLNLTNAHNKTIVFAGSDNADISVPVEDEHNQGVIGLDFLRQFNLVFDYPRGKLYLQPRENAPASPF